MRKNASNRDQEVGSVLMVQHFISHDEQKAHANHDCVTVTALTVNVKLDIMMSTALQTTSLDSGSLK